MLFNSLQYIYLLLATVPIFWLSKNQKIRQLILFFASIYFYMSWSRVFVFLLLGMVVVNWIIGNILGRSKKAEVLWVGIIFNLAILGFFKYINFFIENILSLYFFAAHSSAPALPGPYISIILPLGISFFVFEFISYLVDIYKNKITPESNIIVFSLFVMFFPHLIAGPICRAEQFIPQVKTRAIFSYEKMYKGCYLFLCGFVLKSAVADGIAPYVNIIFASPQSYSGIDNALSVIGFGIQIFTDFFGYSLMALGAALFYGISLPINFNAPYIALSIQDFWRRWHITLSNWLRDYLYISLGGNRSETKLKIQRNLIVTMLLGGLWHGASWNFIIWGLIHGIALAVNRWWAQINFALKTSFVYKTFSWFLTMSVVFIAWIFFRAKSFSASIDIIENIIRGSWISSKLPSAFYELLIIFLLTHIIIHRTINVDIALIRTYKFVFSVLFLCFLSVVYYVNGSDFIYFQF
jgi:alginate O-acetyltransferase complex protein AlgI